MDIMPPSLFLVENPIIVYSFDFRFNCTMVGQVLDSLMAPLVEPFSLFHHSVLI